MKLALTMALVGSAALTFEQSLLGAIGALGATVAYLFRQIVRKHKADTARLERAIEETEREQRESARQVLRLSQTVARLEGRDDGVRALADELLRKFEERKS